MDYSQFLLVKLAEECAEVAQRALKQAQFGKDEVQKDQPLSNKERLQGEMEDLITTIILLEEIGEVGLPGIRNPFYVEKKRARIAKYLELSRSLGKVK